MALLGICQAVCTRDRGRVVEALATAPPHHALRDLRRPGLVALDGGRGQRASTYRLLRSD